MVVVEIPNGENGGHSPKERDGKLTFLQNIVKDILSCASWSNFYQFISDYINNMNTLIP